MIQLMPEDTPRKEVVFVRVDVVEGWLKDLERFQREAGKPATADGVNSAINKIKREVSRQK